MAGTRTRNRLTALAVEKQRRPGLYADGAGLTLVVTDKGVKRWELRAITNGRRRQLGLGVYPQVSLEAARGKAAGLREAIRVGAAMPAARRPRPATNLVDAGPVTFRAAFESYFELKAPQLSNPKHAAQWRSTLETYVFPAIGDTPVAAVTAAEIIDILKPIWNDKPETAKRVLQRMRVVFEAAIVRGDRTTAAPTTGVATVLGARRRAGQRHHAALPFGEVPALVGRLRQFKGRAATRLAFEFLILTASRSGEVRFATWPEFDRAAALWTIPADRMKAREAHVVPLCDRAVQILDEARSVYPNCNLVFPGAGADKPLSDMTLTKVLRDFGLGGRATAHGFRSSFKDWCAEVAKVRDEVSEAALAHKIPDKVRAAYLRTKFLVERRDVMQQWADYLASIPDHATVFGRP
ncbi:MAG: integrase arm-type DNA-binding domain-containing protein [Hyphomicrobiaceae bacterium]